MDGLSNLDETYSKYSLAPTDDLSRFWRSKVKVTAGRQGGEGIHVDAGVSKSHLLVKRHSEGEDLCRGFYIVFISCVNVDGIHTSKSTFGNKTPALSGHGRMPSDDLVLGLPNLSAIQSSVSKMNIRPLRQQTDAAASDAGSGESASKAECSSSDSIDGTSLSSVDASATQAGEQTGLSASVTSVSTTCAPLAAASSVESTSSLPSLPPSLADLQNPATFNIQPSPKNSRKITKASFFDPSRPTLGETANGTDGSADPLSKLDPLWSLKLTGKESTDSEES